MRELEYEKIPIERNSRRSDILSAATERYLSEIPEYHQTDFSKAYVKNISEMTTSIYIDLPMLQDIYLGGLLQMTAEDPVAFSHIVSNIKDYHNRVTATHADYFPDLGISEAQLFEYISDPKHCGDLLLKSPPTTFWPSLRRFHDSIVRENSVLDGVSRQKPDQLRYVVNTWPLTPSLELARWFKFKFHLGIKDSDIRFGIVTAPSHAMDRAEYTASNFFFVYRVNPWIEDTTTEAYKVLVDQTLSKSSIVAVPCITDPEQLEASKSYTYADFIELEKSNLLVLNAYTSFQYYRPLVSGFEELIHTS